MAAASFYFLRIGERRFLQTAVSIAALVPVSAGLAGVLGGPSLFGDGLGGAAFDGHFRYLSGLLLGVGLAFWTFVPRITSVTRQVRTLTLVVVIGGLGRLISLIIYHEPSAGSLFALLMELGVTPALCWWQASVTRREP